MGKLKSLDELRQIRENSSKGIKLRTTGENEERIVVSIGMATCGIAAGARPAMSALINAVDKNKLENVSVIATGCLGYCYAEPMVVVNIPGSEPIRYANVDAALAEQIIERHVMRGELVDSAIFGREVPRGE